MFELKRQIQNRIKTNRNQDTGIGRKAEEFLPVLEMQPTNVPNSFPLWN